MGVFSRSAKERTKQLAFASAYSRRHLFIAFLLFGLSLAFPLLSHAAVQVTVSPTSTSMLSGATTTFTATVLNASNTAVTWSAALGSISSSGIYIAPFVLNSSTLTDTITATSIADNTKSATATATISSGLAGWWPLNEGSGAVAFDNSGNGNNGTWNGSSTNGSHYTGGKVGTYAGYFNGVNNQINASDTVGTNITVSAWINYLGTSTTQVPISGGNANDYFFALIGGALYTSQTNASSGQVYYTIAGGVLTGWHLYATTITTNGNNVSWNTYRDGVSIGTYLSSNGLMPVGISYLGVNASGGSHFFGPIDDVRVYNRALSGAEVQALYNAVAFPSISLTTSTALNFTATHGITATSSQPVVVSNGGVSSSTLHWSATSTQSWLTFSPASSSLVGGASTTVSFIVNPTGLGVGTYNATATIADSSASNTPQTLPVTLTIASTNLSTTITSPSNGATVSSTIPLSASASSTVGIASVQFYLDGGPLGALITSTSSPNTYTYSWNAATLTTGSHTLYALATDNNGNVATSSAISVIGTLSPAILSITTSTSLTFSGTQGSVATTSQLITISNMATASAAALNWSATSTQSWLTFGPASSSLAGGTSQSVSLIANSTGLGIGIYNATATISDPNASDSPQTFGVTLTVNSIISGYPILNVERTFPNTTSTGMVNVKTYGATGNGVTDDTAAIQAAISATLFNPNNTVVNPNYVSILYFPAGTYLVSSPLVEKNASGTWESYLKIQGENRATTIIKLKNNDSLYQSTSSPEDVLDTGSEDPFSTSTGNGNDAFDNYVSDITIDVGQGNPGAVALDFMGNNYCGLRNVTLQSSDPNHVGAAGLSMLRYATGPCLMKNVVINGFNYGIEVANIDYSTTFENLTLFNQSLYGIDNNGNVMSIRGLASQDSVPAIYNQSSLGLVTLLQASLQGGSSSTSAIVNDGTLYARNVTSTGYLSAIMNGTSTISGVNVTEYDSGPVQGLFSSATSSLNLPIQETPQFEDTNLADWTSVVTYGADPTGTSDSSAAIQSAIDSGATTVYFPTGKYLVSQTIYVRGAVRMLDGLNSWIQPTGSAFQNASSPTALFQIATGTSNVTLNDFQFGNWQYSYPGIIFIQQNSSRPVVLSNSDYTGSNVIAAYQNTSQGTGTLFVENVAAAPWQILYPQNVFARQIDPEVTGAHILNNGGSLWVFGYKAEESGTEIETDNGGSTEMLGGYFYPASNVPVNQSAFVINNSRASLEYAVTGYGAPSSNPYPNFQTQVTETQDGTTRSLATTATLTRGYGSMTPLYADTNPSVVSTTVTFPTSGATVSSTVSLSAIATSTAGITSVQFYLDGSPIGSIATSSPYTASWNTTGASNGAHTFYAAATDNNGNIEDSPNVMITVDNQPPAVFILSPVGGSTLSGNSVTIIASTTDALSGVSSVAFYLDGSTLLGTGSLFIQPSYTYVWDTTQVNNGTHTITAVATDGAGNATSSPGVSVTINNNPAPAPTVVSAGGGGGGGGGTGYYMPIPQASTSTATGTAINSSTTPLPTSQAGLEALLGSLQSELKGLLAQAAAQGITIPGVASSSLTFTRNLTLGSRGPDVASLEHYLNTHGFAVVSTPGYAGSLGYETQYFGVKTQAALADFQKSVGIAATGYFGPITRAYLNAHQ